MGEQHPLFTCKAHIFQVDPETRKSWIQLSGGAVNVQIFHDSVKNVYRILSVENSKVLINTVVSARMTFTKTSQKFCQWVDSRANTVYGLGFANETDLSRFMEKFVEVKEATRNAQKNSEHRSSSVDARQTPRSEADWSIQSNDGQLKYENGCLKLALAQSSQNAKKWQDELEILRNNNVKLTTALQESHGNVEEWKRQLQFYRDECSRLRQMVANHTVGNTPSGHDAQELKSLLDAADQRNKEQEQKMLILENQVQKYMSQMGTLQDRLSSVESDNHSLSTELQLIQRRTPQHDNTIIGGTLPRSRPMSPGNISNHRRVQLMRMKELFEKKSQDFRDTIQTKSQDLQHLCLQITQSVAEL
ncbi:unnamed protein product [Didymodactylos carnosus]|uniref:WH1 domain-containing protein n=1 Tax=Didymodactylos carnosus TaxID=1234261 RepID=A0A813YGC6_9BILA|nr:unnamed protein product [Didymodactylos carnosus]CAF1278444.1 unnamed protein product [Didymodactylos carnosus]CAF3669630.1 unnamed protein product [Didymodactylos carnosus]CAF4083380.1 unnamed protein product [Didymodactylos carnosus]